MKNEDTVTGQNVPYWNPLDTKCNRILLRLFSYGCIIDIRPEAVGIRRTRRWT
jgi:hypothetical protein